MFYVYVIKSERNNLYVGRSADLKNRFLDHINKRVKSTRRFRKYTLIFYEAFAHKSDSIRREKYLKTSKGRSSLKQIARFSLNV